MGQRTPRSGRNGEWVPTITMCKTTPAKPLRAWTKTSPFSGTWLQKRALVTILWPSSLSEHILGVSFFCHLGEAWYGIGLHDHNGSWSRKDPVHRITSNPYITTLEGLLFGPSSTTYVFTLGSQHDTNMGDNMDWEAEWNELANKARVSETRWPQVHR